MRTPVNRILIGLIGAALLVGGLLVLIGGLDLQRHWGFTLPSWWPLDDPNQPLLSAETRTRWRDEGWWWPAVFAVLGVVVLASLWWLLAQFRTRRLGQILVPVPEAEYGDGAAGDVRLRGRALEDAITDEIEALDGVETARVTLHGRRHAPRARVVLSLAVHADPASLADRLDRDPMYHARHSAGLSELPTLVRMRSDRHPARRVE